jgi:hypothetical protein
VAIVTVVGMHRSGTSCLAGALQTAGLYGGKTEKKNRYNALGNREHAKILYLHEDLLAANGGNWSRPPEHIIWNRRHSWRRDRVVANFAKQGRHWTFKDPRTVLVFPFWRAAASEIVPIGIFRHPLRVARSLAARGAASLPIEHGVGLWLSYNRRLLELHRSDQFPLLCFDASPEEFENNLGRTVDWIYRRLEGEVPLNPDAARAFYHRSLVHNWTADSNDIAETSEAGRHSELLGEAVSLYRALQTRMAANPWQPEPYDFTPA